MVGFLNAGQSKLVSQRGAGRGEGLRGVKRLGADLAHVVNAHEAGGGFFLLSGELRGLIGQRGAGFGGVGRDEQGSQRGITCGQNAVRVLNHVKEHTTPNITLARYWVFFFCCIVATKIP